MTESFFLAQTKPNCERQASAFLQNDKFEVYYPRAQVKRVQNGRVVQTVQPLFSRYIFIGNDGERGPFFFRSAPGISTLVKRGLEPILVGHCVVDQIKKRENDAGFIEIDEPAPDGRLRNGDLVKLFGERFYGLDAIFVRKLAHERAMVLVTLFGRQNTATVRYDEIRPQPL